MNIFNWDTFFSFHFFSISLNFFLWYWIFLEKLRLNLFRLLYNWDDCLRSVGIWIFFEDSVNDLPKKWVWFRFSFLSFTKFVVVRLRLLITLKRSENSYLIICERLENPSSMTLIICLLISSLWILWENLPFSSLH